MDVQDVCELLSVVVVRRLTATNARAVRMAKATRSGDGDPDLKGNLCD